MTMIELSLFEDVVMRHALADRPTPMRTGAPAAHSGVGGTAFALNTWEITKPLVAIGASGRWKPDHEHQS